MDYSDKCNARHLLEILIDRDATVLDVMMVEYADCINVLIESIWDHGMYEVMTELKMSRDEDERTRELEVIDQ